MIAFASVQRFRSMYSAWSTQIVRRKRGWIGHALKEPASNISMQAQTGNPHGKSKRRRPRNRWRRDTVTEMQRSGHSRKDMENTAQSRVSWRNVINGLCSPWCKSLRKVSKCTQQGREQKDTCNSKARISLWMQLKGENVILENKLLVYSLKRLDFLHSE